MKKRANERPPNGFGHFIRQRRRSLGIGIVEVAQHCGLDAPQLSRIERGKRRPPAMPRLMLLAQKLGIPLESTEFARLLELADKERNPALHEMAAKVGRPKGWNPFAPVGGAVVVVCASLGELVAQATQAAISGEAVEIRVKPRRGRVSVFRLRK